MTRWSIRLANTLNGLFPARITEDTDIAEVVSGTAATLAVKILGVGLYFAFIYMLAADYGKGAVGVYTVSLSVLSIGSVLGSFGFNHAALRFSGQYGLQGRWGDLKGVYRRMASLSFAACLLISVLLYILSGFLSEVLLKDAGFRGAFRIAAAALPFVAVAAINVEALRGIKRIKESEFLRCVNTSFWNIVLFSAAVYFLAFDLQLSVLTYAAGAFLTFAISTLLLLSSPGMKGVARADGVGAKEMVRVSAPMYVSTLSALLIENAPILMLSYFSTPGDAGVFAVALRLSAITAFILTAVNTIVAPKFAELYWSGKKDDLRKVVRFSSKVTFWVTAPVTAALLLVPGFFMGFFGAEFTSGSTALLILCVGQFVNAASGSVGNLLNMTDRQNVFKRITLSGAMINICACLLLVPVWGLTGAALASSIGVSFWNIAAAVYIRKNLGISTYYIPFLRV